MDNGVFISYRRNDSSAYTRALFEALRARLGERQVFMDVDAIEPGVDFVTSIQNAVGRCEALIAVIGKGWLEATDDRGQRRLDNEHDYVRIEIATALQRNVRVIPVLLDGVKMPGEASLPEPLKPLARRNAVPLSHDQFGAGIERLLSVLPKPESPAVTQSVPATASTFSVSGSSIQNTGDGMQVVGSGNTITVNPQATVDALIRAHEQALAAKNETLAEKERRIAELERRLTEGDQRQQLEQAVVALSEEAQKPDAAPGIAEALAALERGETAQAEAIFAAVSRAAVAAGDAAQEQRDVAYREAAAAQRHLGALAFLKDTDRALKAYERAAELDPAHLETWFQLGLVREYAGRLTAARAAYERALDLSEAAGNEREAARANTHLGDVRSAQGDLAGALDAYQQGLAIAKRLATADPSNSGWQTDIAVSCWKLAEVLRGMPDRRAEARPYLERGRAVLVTLREESRLEPSKLGWIVAFDAALAELDSGGDN